MENYLDDIVLCNEINEKETIEFIKLILTTFKTLINVIK